MFGVTAGCASGWLGCIAGICEFRTNELVTKVMWATGRNNRYFFVDFFPSVLWNEEWIVSCGVYLKCHIK